MFENDASNSGGSNDGLINPAGFPFRAGDFDKSAIEASAVAVAALGTSVVTATDSVSTAWTTVKSPGVFETPDAGAVYALMDPAVAGATDMNGVMSRISAALDTYASDLDLIQADLADLEEEAWEFRAEALAGYEVSNLEAYGPLAFVTLTTTTTASTSTGLDPAGTTTISWPEHGPAIDKNTALHDRFNAIFERVSTAATTCANAIQAELQLVCAAPAETITADMLAGSSEIFPWGAAVSEHRNVTESIGFGLANFGKGIWTGGELITGYDAQTGVRSWDTFWKTLGGLGDFVGSTLAVTSVPFMIAGVASMGTNTPFRDFFTDRLNTVASSWGSIVGWDQQAALAGENGWHKWEEDGIAAATESVANVGTFFIPAANIGKVVVVGTKVGSFVVRGVAGVAEFVVPAGSHFVTGVVKVVELTSTGVKTGFRGLIDAIRDTHINVTVTPTTVPGTLNAALDVTHLDIHVEPGTAVSDALGLETVAHTQDRLSSAVVEQIAGSEPAVAEISASTPRLAAGSELTPEQFTNLERSGYYVAFFDSRSYNNYYEPIANPQATFGPNGGKFWVMPIEDGAHVRNASDAYRASGASPATGRAFSGYEIDRNGVPDFTRPVPLADRDLIAVLFRPNPLNPPVRPVAADANGWPHYLENAQTDALGRPEPYGHTAVLSGEGADGFYLLNPHVREFVIDGGDIVYPGSLFAKIEDGVWKIFRAVP